MNDTNWFKLLIAFNALYLFIGGLFFLKDFNTEFIIYVAVIAVLVGGVFFAQSSVRFPMWMLALFSIWGLGHVLGGLLVVGDGVLFAYRIYPFFDYGGDFYVLKYDQVIHLYLYGLVAIMAHHVLRTRLATRDNALLLGLSAILIAVGISGLNEIMEFLIAVSVERHGIGGYENAMLDLIFNLSGAVIAIVLYTKLKRTD